jgi:peptidoglycan/xylan/chitin deacetylase (PgdA/CDA1 family)
MYHDIGRCTSRENFVISESDFKKQIESIRLRYRIISVEEAYLLLSRKDYKGYCIITFDDGFESVRDIAYPLLKEMSIPFTVFVTTGFVGKKGYLSQEDLKELSEDDICTIGSHTITHPQLRDCSDARVEISASREWLYKVIDKPVDYFAYPYGTQVSCSRSNISFARESGYKLAFSAIDAGFNSYSCRDRFFLPRVAGEKLVVQ